MCVCVCVLSGGSKHCTWECIHAFSMNSIYACQSAGATLGLLWLSYFHGLLHFVLSLSLLSFSPLSLPLSRFSLLLTFDSPDGSPVCGAQRLNAASMLVVQVLTDASICILHQWNWLWDQFGWGKWKRISSFSLAPQTASAQGALEQSNSQLLPWPAAQAMAVLANTQLWLCVAVKMRSDALLLKKTWAKLNDLKLAFNLAFKI